MTMPNFIIIGAEKSGTTSLYNYLKQHPQVYMSPVKEPNFFAFEGENLRLFRGYYHDSITDIEVYRALFQNVTHEVAIGEASPTYLHSQRAAERIRHYVPNVKLIAILRNPSERAYSGFIQLVRNSGENVTAFNPTREKPYVQKGFYYDQLKRYFDIFDHDHIRVYLYEDLKISLLRFLQDVFNFINVDKSFTPDTSIIYNKGGVPKSKIFHSSLNRLRSMKKIFMIFFPEKLLQRTYNSWRNFNLAESPRIPIETRKQLCELYREDILQLQDLIQRDLSNWLT